MTALCIHLLGPFEVLRDGQLIASREWRSQQTRAILKVLVTRHGHVVTADQLLDLLWPDEEPEAARRRLHVRVSQLRRALGPDDAAAYVLTVEGGYTVNPEADCWIDTWEFESQTGRARRCQEAGDLDQAIAAYEMAHSLYRGDFLEEDLYADWTFAERERLRERFLTMLTELAECYAQQGRYRRAVARCHDVLAADPWREAVYVRLMLYHYYAGEQVQALRAYERCRQVLADELDVEPLPATVTLAEQIRAGALWAVQDAPRYPPPAYEGRLFEVPYSLGHTPFVGREREYAWLVQRWRDPETRVLLIEGEAGVGKSRLVDEFLGYAAAQEAQVLRSRMATGERPPYAPVVDALRPLVQRSDAAAVAPATLAALAFLFPELKSQMPDLPPLPALPAEREQRRLFAAVETLAQARVPEGALLVVDDAHRAGSASCQLLAHLARTLTVVLIYRSEETPPEHPLRATFQPLRREGRVAALTLERLPRAAVQALIRRLARDELPDLAQQVAARTDGNPLFVVALLQHMFEEGGLYVDAGGNWAVAREGAASLPPTVRETIEARLRRLSREQRQVFDLAAVLGGEFDFALLQHASQEAEGRLLATLDLLLESGLLIEPRTAGRREFALAHDCYAEVAYETLPGVRRRQLHRRAGEAIESVYQPDLAPHYADLAYHYRRAEELVRERRYARLAGEQAAARFANAEAEAYLRRALDLTPEEEATRAERYALLLALERVYDVQGAREAQVQTLAELEALAEALDHDRLRTEAALRRASYLCAISDFAAMSWVAQTATRLAGRCQAVELEAAGRYQWGRACFGLADWQAAEQQLEAALALARTAGLRWMEGDILRLLGNTCFGQHRIAECQAYFEEALSIHRQVGDRRGELGALNNLALITSRQEFPHARSQTYLEQALLICREIGDRFAEGVVVFNLAANFHRQGDYGQARAYYERSLAVRQEIGAREGEGETLTYLGDLYCDQGDLARARTHFEQGRRLFREMGDRRREGRAIRGLADVQLSLGDYEGARLLFQKALAQLRGTGDEGETTALVGLSRLFRLVGDPENACDYGRRALSLTVEVVDPHREAVAMTTWAHALVDSGKLAEAADVYRQALAKRRQMGEQNLGMEPLAGLAHLALIQEDLVRAQAYVAEIVTHLEKGTLDGARDPFPIYLTCYRVLQAHQARGAQELLARAYRQLQERAAAIEDEALRRSYLENVAGHQQVVREFQRMVGGEL
jgi:DNA-binding SARP family transcriptional activator